MGHHCRVTLAWSSWVPNMSPWLVLSMLVLNCDSLLPLGVFRFLLKNKKQSKTQRDDQEERSFLFPSSKCSRLEPKSQVTTEILFSLCSIGHM